MLCALSLKRYGKSETLIRFCVCFAQASCKVSMLLRPQHAGQAFQNLANCCGVCRVCCCWHKIWADIVDDGDAVLEVEVVPCCVNECLLQSLKEAHAVDHPSQTAQSCADLGCMSFTSQGIEGHVRPAGKKLNITLKRKTESLPLAPSTTINLATESPEEVIGTRSMPVNQASANTALSSN